MSILSDRDILQAKEEGDIIIEPFNADNLKNTMYDVTLGENYYSFSDDDVIDYWSPSDQYTIDSYWGYPKKALSGVIVVKPGEMILGHTQEFIGSVKKYTTQMSSRSTMGRCGLRFCSCAGRGDVGYFNRWTMEIENVSKRDIYLKVGTRVASIIFHSISSEPLDSYQNRGSYTTNSNLEELQDNWQPSDMLPKAT